jgi:5-methylcytosine-specific restriction endonuclease McrBC regulatory subunit McrC
MRVLARMDDVGELRSSDLRAATDRRTAHYRDALSLAPHILRGERRTLAHGTQDAWTFLIRTPEMVESGLRQALSERLTGRQVKVGTISLHGTTMTANPDLVFDDGLAVAEVKYKLSGKDWRPPDLYQAVAFAAAARTEHAAIVGFSTEDAPSQPRVCISVRSIDWNTNSSLDPESAADRLAQRIDTWLEGCAAP